MQVTNLQTKGYTTPRIEFGLETIDGKRFFFLKDNGVGFESAMANRLFKPFTRLHDKTEYPGHGIGLVIAQRVIQRHGGTIAAESNPGAGTTFRFTLPLTASAS